MPVPQLRQDAMAILQAGLDAADPMKAVSRNLELNNTSLRAGQATFDLRDFRDVKVVGMGKASAVMAKAVLDVLGDRVSGGLVIVKRGHRVPLPRIQIVEAGHPVPDESGEGGTRAMIQLLSETTEEDLVVCVLSGGGSALSPSPAPGLTLADKQDTTRRLLECGATIHQLNAIRKHLSQIKGGRLAKLAYPSPVLSLVLSDVIGDDLDTIASGPTVPDPTTFYDCFRTLARFKLTDAIPTPVLRHLEAGVRGEVPETPKASDPVFGSTHHVMVGSNRVALEAAKRAAEERGYRTLVLSSFVEGETREVAKVHTAIVKEILATGHPVPPPACIISGGETTVTVRGSGKGGRNQEFALASATGIQGLDGVVVLSAGTDGTDGPTEAAGAMVDGGTVQRGLNLGLDAQKFLAENDSYHFFDALDGHVKTGPTLTNVMDLRLLMVAGP